MRTIFHQPRGGGYWKFYESADDWSGQSGCGSFCCNEGRGCKHRLGGDWLSVFKRFSWPLLCWGASPHDAHHQHTVLLSSHSYFWLQTPMCQGWFQRPSRRPLGSPWTTFWVLHVVVSHVSTHQTEASLDDGCQTCELHDLPSIAVL